MKTRKEPLRMCAGCGEMKSKKQLIRVVKNNTGEIFCDLTGKQNGRGAYLCKSPACLQRAQKARRLEKSFACQIPDEVYQRLAQVLAEQETQV